MAMKYQKGTVNPRGKKVKMWYGKYTVYLRNEEGKEVGKRRNIPLCPKAGTPKWKAEQMLHTLILNETGVPAKTSQEFLPTRSRSAGSLRNDIYRCGRVPGVRPTRKSIPTRSSITSWIISAGFRWNNWVPLKSRSGSTNLRRTIRSPLSATATQTFVR
jgi:hypothetical protein